MNLVANSIIDLTALAIILLLYLSDRRNRERDLSGTLFDGMLLSMVCYLLADLIAWYVDGRRFPGGYGVQMALNSLIYLGQIVSTFLWFLYTDYWYFRSAERIKKCVHLYGIPFLLELVLLGANVYTGWVFRINEAHFYERGTLFLPCMIFFFNYAASSLVLSLMAFFRAGNREKRIDCLWMAGFMFPPCVASAILVLLVNGLSVTPPAYALSFLMIYLNVHQKRLIDEKQKVAQRDAELQRANVAIMLSQIQPHFLYNSLTSIYGLCETDPGKAQEAVGMFSNYLRFNMDSLKKDRPVPFSTELLHVKTYLALEQMRFDDMLRVVWDIGTEGFMIPSLTLQPLVENAVKHGLGKSETGGTVTISVKEREDRYTITVADDGVGFDPERALGDGRTHVGIRNVRERLASLSHATLEIQSEKGAGTRAVITIPKEATL